MGRYTELYRYLECPPKQLPGLKKELHFLTITTEIGEMRQKLKLYEKLHPDKESDRMDTIH